MSTNPVYSFKLVFLGEQSGEIMDMHNQLFLFNAAPLALGLIWASKVVECFYLVGKTSIMKKFMFDGFDNNYQV